jgi:hypothetical protein
MVALVLTVMAASVPSSAYADSSAAYVPAGVVASDSDSAGAVLLFGVGVHIEPFNGQGRNGLDYNQQAFFVHHVEDIMIIASIAEKYRAKLTVQGQTPFTRVTSELGVTVLADLEAHGHEIGLHFHEDAHLGENPEALSVETWAEAMSEEVASLKAAGATSVRYWSGGNLYSGLLEAAALAGLDVMSDWKNPHSQRTHRLVLGVNPWRPSGGPSENDLTAFAKHDPDGKIVYLPDGYYDPAGFAAKRRIIQTGGDQAYFDFLARSLQRSLEVSDPDRVNVFHITIHLGEFRGDPARPYAILDQFLAEVVSPLVASGRVRCATFSEMADSFIQWENSHPGVEPRKNVLVTQQGKSDEIQTRHESGTKSQIPLTLLAVASSHDFTVCGPAHA